MILTLCYNDGSKEPREAYEALEAWLTNNFPPYLYYCEIVLGLIIVIDKHHVVKLVGIGYIVHHLIMKAVL